MKPLAFALLLLPAAIVLNGAAARAEEGGRPLSTSLDGKAEIPGPGDPDGSGTATLRINPGQSQVCYELTVKDIDTATAAHIHRGAVDVAGPVVVTLATPSSGSSKDCAEVARALAQELIKTPAAFYVNVHNAAFPAGAIRGQLGK